MRYIWKALNPQIAMHEAKINTPNEMDYKNSVVLHSEPTQPQNLFNIFCTRWKLLGFGM